MSWLDQLFKWNRRRALLAASRPVLEQLEVRTHLSIAPTAVPGGPYTVDEGGTITLDGTASSDSDGTIATYEWDLNYDGVTFDVDATGATPSYSGADDAGPIAIALRVTDDAGDIHVATTTLTVNNVMPSAAVTGAGSADEGSVYTLNLDVTDPGTLDTFTWSIDWGDGSPLESVSGGDTTAAHTYADNGSYTVSASVADDDGGTSAAVAHAVTVNNVAPTAAISGTGSVDEGSAYTISLDATDPSTTDTFTWSIDWGDGSPLDTAIGRNATASHTYADNGPYTISATVLDDDGGNSAAVTHAVTVNNVAPTVTVTGIGSADEGSAYALTFSASGDPAPDTVSGWIVDWGDGTVENYGAADSSATHAYADNGTYTVTVTATDEDGSYAQTHGVTVGNVAPVAAVSGSGSADEGSLYTINLDATDPSTADSFTWTIDWGDGSAAETVTGRNATASHAYADGPNGYTITATVTDDDGATSAAATHAVTVNNVAPTVAVSGSGSADEGSAYAITFSASGDPGSDTLTGWSIDWGDGTVEAFAAGTTGASHAYADNGTYTISVTATDEDGSYSTTHAVAVGNITPTAAISGAGSADEGSVYTINLDATDPGTLDTFSWSIDWGDGSPLETVSGGDTTATHTYADNGSYTISATVADDDGGTSAAVTHGVIVGNIGPAAAISGTGSADEGSAYTINLDATDPSTADTFTWTIDWGDGSPLETVTGRNTTASHTYADGPNGYTITASVVDDDGAASAAVTHAVMVNNVAPTPGLTGDTNVNEGSTYTLNTAWTDPGVDTVTSWIVDWGDGTIRTVSGDITFITHTYADGSNTYTITASATDSDGATGTSTTLVTVDNVAPTVSVTGSGSVDEGSTYAVNFSASGDPGPDTISGWTVDWGDGSPVEALAADATTANHIYADGPNAYTITVSALDEDGAYAETHAVTVNDVSPMVNVSGTGSADEGSPYAIAFAVSGEPGADVVTGWSVDWGDGTIEAYGAADGGASHVYADNGTYAITVTATDEDGSYSTAHTVTIGNVTPAAAISGTGLADEGSAYTVNLDATDPSTADTFTWTIDWGDGSAETVSGRNSTASHVYADNGGYTITVVTSDDDGGTSAAATHAVTVSNVVPTADPIVGTGAADEGSAYSITLASSDPGSADTHDWTVDWGDGTVETVSGADPTAIHVYADNGTYAISASVADDDAGTSAAVTHAVTVSNVTPAAAITGTGSTDEGSAYTVNLDATDPSTADTFTWSIDWGDGSAAETVTGRNTTASHTYADGPNGFTITATVTDDDGATSAAATHAVTVNNVVPTVSVSGTGSADEGSAYAITFSASGDPAPDTAAAWSVDWGDGTVEAFAAGDTGASHAYADNGTYTISVTATDEDGSYSTTHSVAIGNVTPTAAISGTGSADEGSAYTINLDATDQSTADTFTWSIDWGDGSPLETVTGRNTTASHTYADDGSYTIFATVADDDGGASEAATHAVTVSNFAPTVTVTGSGSADEGSAYAIAFSASGDPGSDTVTGWNIDWGDGTVETYSPGDASATHAYADDGAYTITVTATDEDGSYAQTHGVTVGNVAPVAAVSGSGSADEGSLYTINLDATDPSSADTFTWSIDWGDGSPLETVTGRNATASHAYADGPNSYTITASVVDDDSGASAAVTHAVTVNNAAPVVSIVGASSIDESSEYSISFSAVDPGADTITSYTVDWGDGTIVTMGGAPTAVTHTYPDGPATYTVTVTASDSDGAIGTGTHTVTVNNVPPAVSVTGSGSVDEGSAYTVSFSASGDPGPDTLTGWTVDWGDGSPVESYAAGDSAATHVYAESGTYTVTATITDEDGSYPATHSVTVANVAPTADPISGSGASDEGSFYSITLSSSDPSTTDVHTWTIDWGDGTIESIAGADPTATHTYADNGAYTISATVADDDGGTSAAVTQAVNVNNVAPTVALAPTKTGVRGQSQSFTGSFADAGTADTHEVAWDFGDGTTIGFRSAADIGALTPSHVFVAEGTYAVTLSVRDKDGAITTSTQSVTIRAVKVQRDPADSAARALVVGGTDGDDDILLRALSDGRVKVFIGGASQGSYRDVSRIIVFGQDGNDGLALESTLAVPSILHGGRGKDTLCGGAAGDVLVGDGGKDVLRGRAARDVLIGGTAADAIYGNAGEDLIVAGSTAHDGDDVSLLAIMAEWERPKRSIVVRSEALSGLRGDGLNAGVLLDSASIDDDGSADLLTGSTGRDWFIFGQRPVNPVSDLQDTDLVTEL